MSNSRAKVLLRSKLFVLASQMPALSHHRDKSVPFDYRNSEVCSWLLTNDDFWRWIFDKTRDIGAIVYDKENSTWIGSATERGKHILNDPGDQPS